jgi:GWxTD domain-containing protein
MTSRNKIYFLFLLILCACASKKESGYGHLAEEKEKKIRETSYLPLDYRFFRENDSISKLYYRVSQKHLLEKYDSLGVKNTQFRIRFQIRNNQMGSKSLFETVHERILKDSSIFLDSIEFELPLDKTIFYEIELTDLHKRTTKTYSTFWEREAMFIPEDFMLLSLSTGMVLTQPYIFNERVGLRSRMKAEKFKAVLYQTTQNHAQHMYEIENNPLYAKVEIASEQFVNLKELEELINTTNRETFFKVESNGEVQQKPFCFTKLIENEGLSIQPLIYFLEKDETVSFNSWVKFWFTAAANDPIKAEKLIKEFNRRVEYANTNFSSHKMGWKTDRGMMYLLHGPPDRISDDVRTETWSYGFTSSVATSFVFVRNPSGLHSSDYVLERSIGYRDMENAAIQRWKNGWIKFGIDGNQ